MTSEQIAEKIQDLKDDAEEAIRKDALDEARFDLQLVPLYEIAFQLAIANELTVMMAENAGGVPYPPKVPTRRGRT